MNQKLQAFEKSRKEHNKPPAFQQALIGIGGSNAQNVGGLVREMQKPLLFHAPTENPEIRQALSIHYRGIDLRLPPKPMQAYQKWIERQLQKGDDQIKSTLRTRQQEQVLVCDITEVILRRGRYACTLLETYQDQLPSLADSDSLLSPNVDNLMRDLIEASSRKADWADAFSEYLARAIASFEFEQNSSLPLDGAK